MKWLKDGNLESLSDDWDEMQTEETLGDDKETEQKYPSYESSSSSSSSNSSLKSSKSNSSEKMRKDLVCSENPESPNIRAVDFSAVKVELLKDHDSSDGIQSFEQAKLAI